MAYYNVDAILTDAQKAPCTFELSVAGLAPLNHGSTVEQGTKLDLPLWMAELLAVSKPAGPDSNSLASLDMPNALGQRVLNALRADPKSVDVKAQAPYFYGLAERMLDLFDEEDMVDILTETFKKRAHDIADKAQNTRASLQGDSFMITLDQSEQQLFRAAHDSRNTVEKWFTTTSRA